MGCVDEVLLSYVLNKFYSQPTWRLMTRNDTKQTTECVGK